jgi:hypothetical protein
MQNGVFRILRVKEKAKLKSLNLNLMAVIIPLYYNLIFEAKYILVFVYIICHTRLQS